MLEELPGTLDRTYERTLRGINEANRDHAYRLLQCLAIAVRPLRVAELAEVLAIDFWTASSGGTSKLNTSLQRENKQAVLSACSSFISISYDVVQLSHLSVKEFLLSSWLSRSSADLSRFYILLEPAHTVLAKACLGVLLRLDEHVDLYYAKNNFALVRYAAEHWVEHAQFEKVTAHIRDEMDHLFDSDKPYFAAWLQIHDIDTCPPFPLALHDFFVRGKKSNTGNPLYYAALCGFHDLAKFLIIKDPHQMNANGGYFTSPLRAALGREHLAVAQLLYKPGADVGVQGHIKTPLNVAPNPGRSEFVEWLLSHGADPNLRGDGDPYTSLHAAAYCGHLEVCRMLLQHKADQNALDNNDGRTPLHLASRQGHTDIAQLLLEHGVDLNARDLDRSTALHVASEKGHIDVVRLLVEYGADVNARSMVWM